MESRRAQNNGAPSPRQPEIAAILASLSGRPVAASGFAVVVSPSISTMYPSLWRAMNGLLRAGGAAAIRQVASGIPEFADRCAETIRRRGPGIHILSACPASTDFVSKEFAEFYPAILPTASPMAISSEAALRAAGIPGGTAFAISPCSLKKEEEARVRFDMRVIDIDLFLRELAAAGISVEDFPESEFDASSSLREASGCEISCIVGEELKNRGVGSVRVMKIEGAAAARRRLSELSVGRTDGRETIIVELTFCEKGCAKEPRP